MARDRKDLGARKFVRVDLRKRGFLIPAPDAPWIECYIHDISENGACQEEQDRQHQPVTSRKSGE